MLIALFLLADEPAPTCRTRAGCDAAVRAVISGSDTDGDSRLSRAEWTRMGEKALARVRDEMTPADMERLRRDIADDFGAEDADDDGYLLREEMLRIRMAAFPCFDSDGNGTITQEERQAGIDKCRPGGARRSP